MEGARVEEVRNKILQIIDQFSKEELGNRLSQFSVMALRSLIMAELNKLLVEESKKEDL